MNSLLTAIRTFLFSNLAPIPLQQVDAASPSARGQKAQGCPVTYLCLGCDGNVNCTLARLAVSATSR